MVRVSVRLDCVDTQKRCGKPNCNTGSHTFHRHHRRHEGMWLGIWAMRRRGEPKWYKFIDRYRSFLARDWEPLCDHHHAEIHQEYDQIIQLDREFRQKSLSEYSWRDARDLMSKLEKYFWEWYKRETPGIRSDAFRRNRLTKARPNASKDHRHLRR